MSACSTRCAILAATIIVLAAGCGRSPDDDAPAPPKTAVHVRVARITERSFADVVTATGQWRAANEFVVATPFAATVESLEPRVGDHVTQGATVGVLVTRESRATLRGAELMLRQAADDDARAEAERALALARRELVRVPIVASASGTVVRRSAEPGTELAESAELLAIVPRDDLVFEAHVPAADAARVSTGQTARIAIEGVEPVVAAVQRRLPGVGDGDQSVLVWLAPKSAPPSAAIGRFGTAHIEIGAARHGVGVPDSALVEDDLTGETRLVRVDTSGVAIWTWVTLGRADLGWHELLSPALAPGTAVVVAGQRGLPDSVTVVTP